MEKAFYITTTLPYVNADPHIGHAYEFVEADIFARYWRLLGRDVFFNTGTDEHGQKIAQKADEKGEGRQEYVNHFAGRFKESLQKLNLSYDAFIRTTDENHKKAAQEIWKRCEANSDIYKNRYNGLYCVGCESFKKEADLVEGICPLHNVAPEVVEEENYFFKLSNYQAYLEEYLSKPGSILPEWRRLEALNFVKQGLEDFSISREKSRLDWGIPVPGDEEQVMYVWFDALTNYISTLGWPDEHGNYKKFWVEGETLQVAGKDQVRFQSIMWQAMLKSAGLPSTKKVVYHGFITSGGQKMSKTMGNVVSPFEIIDTLVEKGVAQEQACDALRYYLALEIPTFEDGDFTWEKFWESYNAQLANGLGNLVSRVLKMATNANLDFRISNLELDEEFRGYLDQFEVQKAGEWIWRKIKSLDEYIAKEEPFKVVKVDPEKGKKQIEHLLLELESIAFHLQPFLPNTAGKISGALKNLGNLEPLRLFPRV